MPSAKKHRRKKPFVNTNKKKLWKNLKKKHLKKIDCPQVWDSYDKKKSMLKNFIEMGLATNANKVLPPPSKPFRSFVPKDREKYIKKPEVITELQKIVELGEKLKPLQKIPTEEVHFCEYMLGKHVDDYKAMAWDPKNVFQLTPKQIRARLRKYQSRKALLENLKEEKLKKSALSSAGQPATSSTEDDGVDEGMET